MKRLLLLLIVLCVSIGNTYQASARGIIIYGNGDELSTLEKLPTEFMNDSGEHYNFGVYYKSFSLFWLPVWNYGEYKYALVNDAEDSWIELSIEEAKELGEELNFEVADKPTLPLGVRIGLKPVILLLILFGLYSFISGKKKKKAGGEELETEETPAEG